MEPNTIHTDSCALYVYTCTTLCIYHCTVCVFVCVCVCVGSSLPVQRELLKQREYKVSAVIKLITLTCTYIQVFTMSII